jgi:adenosylcobinamide-GDP ribazoletransferase
MLRASAAHFPGVGWLVGLLVAGLSALLLLGLPSGGFAPLVVAAIGTAFGILLTGAFHEDGLADTVDGLGGGWDKLRILEIMKDSRVGSYGVVATVLALLGKFTLLAALDSALVPFALLAGHAISRFCAVLLLATMDYVREDLLAKAKPLATRLSSGAFMVALFFAMLPLLWLPAEKALLGVALAALLSLWLAAKFRRWLAGYTGDCLGATQQVAEIAFYLGILVQWPR